MFGAKEGKATSILVERWAQETQKLTELADALPESKFEERLVPEVRTPGEVLRHVAYWNQYVVSSLRGEKSEYSANELAKADYATKGSIIEVLNRSAQAVSSALREREPSSESETAELVLPFLEHTAEHYGQLAVYARLMGITPPASKGGH